MDNGVGIDYGSGQPAGQRGPKGETIRTSVKHKNKQYKEHLLRTNEAQPGDGVKVWVSVSTVVQRGT